MKKALSVFLITAVVFLFAACSAAGGQPEGPSANTSASSASQAANNGASEAPASSAAASQQDGGTTETALRQISVQFGQSTIVYALNDSPAADARYAQLPLRVAIEDYSTNEKIFYPPKALDTGDSPLAQAGAGTLAYYAPWGDVVFFYGDYRENPSLFELGQVVSGGEQIREMSGTVTIEAIE